MTEKTKIDDGGFVYPFKRMELVTVDPALANRIGTSQTTEVEYSGITRRNECADRIAAGIQANPEFSQMTPDQVANLAYIQADALIAHGRKR